ncbi:MAG: VOC family protein [Armatimonadota bacterium]
MNIFVNLPVKDLDKSMMFFRAIGFEFNMQFTNENAACMIIGKDSYVMLLVEEFFRKFTKKDIPDASRYTEVILAISAESREKVDEIVQKALDAGGKLSNPQDDMGWMYGWSFQDIDNHLWEVLYMDINAIPENMNNEE